MKRNESWRKRFQQTLEWLAEERSVLKGLLQMGHVPVKALQILDVVKASGSIESAARGLTFRVAIHGGVGIVRLHN